MDHLEKQAAESRPIGYSRVRYGRIRPDDLVYSPFTSEWLRADDPSWQQSCEFAGDAVYVARVKLTEEPKEVTPKTADLERDVLIHSQQGSLWGGF